jgi:uncharacterized protein YpiB (UPF0302 family)
VDVGYVYNVVIANAIKDYKLVFFIAQNVLKALKGVWLINYSMLDEAKTEGYKWKI